MNMNLIGKGLVFIHLGLSIVALTWAAGLFLQFRDYGWTEPRMEVEKRIASEYDKRVVAYGQAREAVKGQTVEVEKLINELYLARQRYSDNLLLYKNELERLRTEIAKDDKDLQFRTPRVKGGTLETQKGERSNPPVLDDLLKGITKSYAGYKKELAGVEAKIKTEIKKGEDWTAKHAILTLVLNGGKDDKGEAYPGLYELIEEEKRAQDEAKKELDYLEKIWAPTLQEAEIFVERRNRLQRTLDQLLMSRKKTK